MALVEPSAIETVQIGRSSVVVTKFILGCAPIGGLYQEVTARMASAALEEAWNQGVRCFDTAPHYGAGLSERRLGDFLRKHGSGQATVSTKVGRRLRVANYGVAVPPAEFAGEEGLIRIRDYSAEGVRRSLEESLERLGIDRVDVLLVHDPEEFLDEACAGAFPALVELREAGVVGAIGAGMNLCAPLERIVSEVDIDCVLIAGRYTLLDQEAAERLLPLCRIHGVSVLAGGVFNSGVLADPQFGSYFDYLPADSDIIERARSISAVCSRYNVPLGAAAIQFALRHEAVSAVVIGARSDSEVRQDIEYYKYEVPEDLFRELVSLGLLRIEI